MYMRVGAALYKIRFFLIVPLFVVADLFLLSLLPTALGADGTNTTVSAQSATATASTSNAAYYDTPNAVTDSVVALGNKSKRALIAVGTVSKTILGATAHAITESGKFVGRTVSTVVTFSVDAIVASAAFTIRTPGTVLGMVSDAASSNAITQPSNDKQIPKINLDYFPATVAAAPAAPPAPTTEPAKHPLPTGNTETVWPIHGAITTLFGVPHWPYQPVHTGLDISSGQRSGVTPVIPFKPGRVVEAVNSFSGLGNRVTVDHGGGVTSVYGHLASIAVHVGQDVTKSTVLGYEGSTGASTGTHLHLEIRINGQLVNPQEYISGQP